MQFARAGRLRSRHDLGEAPTSRASRRRRAGHSGGAVRSDGYRNHRLTLATVFVQKVRKGFFHARVVARATELLRALNDVALEASRQLAPSFQQSGTETGEDAQL
jgi:hypothetical protein